MASQPLHKYPDASFLGLPGEIRNQIYSLCAIPNFTPTEIHHSLRSDAAKQGTQAGTYAGLTRVCRQIRHEYLPIQQRKARVEVCFHDLDRFLQTFLNINNPIGYLKIRLCYSSHRGRRNHKSFNVEANILPLLQMLTKSPARCPVFVVGPAAEDRRAQDDDILAKTDWVAQELSRTLVRCWRVGMIHPGWLTALQEGPSQLFSTFTFSGWGLVRIGISLERGLETQMPVSKTKCTEILSAKGVNVRAPHLNRHGGGGLGGRTRIWVEIFKDGDRSQVVARYLYYLY